MTLKAEKNNHRERGRVQLDNRMKQLLRELGRAINDAVSDSDHIAETIARIKTNGYDVFLMLDAIVALNRQSEAGDEDPAGDIEEQKFLKSLKIRLDDQHDETETGEDSDMGLTITPSDVKFLRSLKIKVDGLG